MKPEAKLLYDRAWREKNREKVRTQQRAWKLANADYMKDLARKRYLERRDDLIAYQATRRARPGEAERIRARNAEYRQNNREILAVKERARRLRIPPADQAALLESQGNACAICLIRFDGNTKHRHFDHDHDTGKVRGVLCRDCNLALGNAKDSVSRLEALIAYLHRHGK